MEDRRLNKFIADSGYCSRREADRLIEEGKVKMYACGPTVYNYIHVGNARPIIMFDVLRRYFEYRGMAVTFVQNFTDVDDKIINRAAEEGASPYPEEHPPTEVREIPPGDSVDGDGRA